MKITMTGNYINKALRRVFRKPHANAEKPTIFHLTHHKAGSQWVKEVLYQTEWRRVVKPKPQNLHIKQGSLRQGLIYPTVYLKKQDVRQLMERFPDLNTKQFFIMRDLRDTLVSLYFSLKYSHKVVSESVGKQKANLKNMSDEEGLMHLIDNGLKLQSDIQLSWVNESNVRIYRYEDLIENQHHTFKDIFDYCEINCSKDKFDKIIRLNSFEKVSGGRERGIEDIHNHQRKGVSGDWKNHFTDNVKQHFKHKFADTLIQTGYETDAQW